MSQKSSLADYFIEQMRADLAAKKKPTDSQARAELAAARRKTETAETTAEEATHE